MKGAILTLQLAAALLFAGCGSYLNRLLDFSGWSQLALPGFALGVICFVASGTIRLRRRVEELERRLDHLGG
jgi:hypothetical protein